MQRPLTCNMITLLLIGAVLTVHLYCPRSVHVTTLPLLATCLFTCIGHVVICLLTWPSVLPAVSPPDVPDLKVPLSVVLSDDAEPHVVNHCPVFVRQRYWVTVQPCHLKTIKVKVDAVWWMFYEVKAGVVCSCSIKTVWSMPERFRGEFFTMGRYTNPASFKCSRTFV